MKRFTCGIIMMVLVLSIVFSAFAAADETVELIEANGHEICIYLNRADKKSGCESKKTTYVSKDMGKGILRNVERYKGDPYAVISSYTTTTRPIYVEYRADDTLLENVAEGFVMVRRGLDYKGKRVDIEEAYYIFQAKLDKEGRKFDVVDFVFVIDGETQSITHIEKDGQVNYYLVDGDARVTTTRKASKKPVVETEDDPEEKPEPEKQPEEETPVEETPIEETPEEETPEQEPESEPDPEEDDIVLVPRVESDDNEDQASGGKLPAGFPFN
jgi:hypothetical protein